MKYSLRSLVLIVTLAALAMGWWNHRRFCLKCADECDRLSSKFFFEAMIASDYAGTAPDDEEQRKRDAFVAKCLSLQKSENRRSKDYRLAVWRPWLRLTLE